MLKDYEKVLYESQRNGKPFCLVVAAISEGKLQICRIDFEEWERNSRTGQVEIYYLFDEANTTLLANLLGTAYSGQFIAALRKKCTDRCFSISFFSQLRKLCEDNNIHYDYRVWY